MSAFIPKRKPTIPAFRSSSRRLCDGIFVCDAFGSAHRAHASVVGITKFVRQSAAGLLMEKELAYLGKAISNPERPFVAVLGGAKVSDKIEVVQNLMKLADAMLIGGAMAYTFLKSQGLPVGKSLVENDKLDLARDLLEEARNANSGCCCRWITFWRSRPIPTETKISDIAETPDGWMGLDVGPKTIELFARRLRRRGQSCGTARSACSKSPHLLRERSRLPGPLLLPPKAGATSIIGGGDSVAAAEQSGVAKQISHISTGGGASLEFLAGEKLPGVEALTDEPNEYQQEGDLIAPTCDSRQLEDVQDAARRRALFSRRSSR